MFFVILMVASTLCQLKLISCLPAGKSWMDDTIVFQDDQPWNGQRYSFGFQTLFGTARREKAELKENSLGMKYIDVEGEYSYPMPDGSFRRVLYRANDQGYQETASVAQKLPLKAVTLNNYNAITTDVKDEMEDNSLIVKPNSDTKSVLKLTNDDRIFFPTEKDEGPTSTTPASVLTTVMPTMSSQNVTNLTETVDYYYDELGNRVGGIPPAVLGSLLG